MSYTHYRVESPSGTTRLSGYVSGALSITYGGQPVETISSATDFTKYCSNKMMKSDIVIGNNTIYCGNQIMPSDLRILTSTSDYGNYAIFTGSGSWVCPVNVTSINVMCVGGGGAGGRPVGYNGEYCGGGGGGGFCTKTPINVTPNTTYSIEIGAGGNALRDTVRTRNGFGGTTSFKIGDRVLAYANGGYSPDVNAIWSETHGQYLYYQDNGGNGGAGGGGGGYYYQSEEGQTFVCGGNGGDNGGNGVTMSGTGGTGQGSSAVYSPITGIYYSGGGGGGNCQQGGGVKSRGGYTGGGYGANSYGQDKRAAADGEPNTGGGGGGGSRVSYYYEANGGTGILIINW